MYRQSKSSLTVDHTFVLDGQNELSHQLSFTKNGGSTGTLAIEVMPRGSERFEALTIGGVAVSISMAANTTFGPFDGLFDQVKVTPTGFDGTNFRLDLSGI